MEDPVLEATHNVDTVLPLGANLDLEPDEVSVEVEAHHLRDPDLSYVPYLPRLTGSFRCRYAEQFGERCRLGIGRSKFLSIDGISEAWPSSTASLRSSIVRAMEENGRIYHGYKDGKYVLPTDQEELDRQAFQYQLCQLTFENRLNFAPIYHPHRVLDVGCGIAHGGLFIPEPGEEHPESEVIGVDLSPVQPGFTPPNVHYEIDDLEEEWSFSRKFDYIHSMMMTGAFRDWPNFHRQAFDNLNPGGWLEIQDIDFPMRCDDGTIPPECDLGRWNDLMMEAGRRSGFLLDTCGRAAEMMANAGFIDIVRIPFKWPINQWPRDVRHKTLGLWTEANFSVGLESMTLALFTRFMGWRKEEVWDFSARASAEWRDVRRHGYFDVYVTYGRKP
ncbi:Secondary metabolism regulator laeA [Colletotrichum gloeosporioides]|uniref:Secondary metabolism regulator laeA n=1 Tax=Colletotrichum gloeosporioides TaxID=474922 RepID=A0A8H4C7Q9_COLGL|nr:Secondary metabolism regulator laeA [Colletotrichum gloeosporioides]KAF3798683.1 Secondary metabolism regulator laeA [Colletotrichum gloeosporioides]